VEDVGQGEDAFKLAEIAAIYYGEQGPVASPAEHFFEGFVGEDHGQRALGWEVCGGVGVEGVGCEALYFGGIEQAPFAYPGSE
jgi:hypothetical protein